MIDQECRYCHHGKMRVTEGKGQHSAGLECAECGRHGGWLSKARYDAYVQTKLYGRVDIDGLMKQCKVMETTAIAAARVGDFMQFMAACNQRDKYFETLEEHG